MTWTQRILCWTLDWQLRGSLDWGRGRAELNETGCRWECVGQNWVGLFEEEFCYLCTDLKFFNDSSIFKFCPMMFRWVYWACCHPCRDGVPPDHSPVNNILNHSLIKTFQYLIAETEGSELYCKIMYAHSSLRYWWFSWSGQLIQFPVCVFLLTTLGFRWRSQGNTGSIYSHSSCQSNSWLH